MRGEKILYYQRVRKRGRRGGILGIRNGIPKMGKILLTSPEERGAREESPLLSEG
ncbi:MAG: hypothetical protein HYY20_04705 [Candidatus Tectomicrobia bacterium]|uniref:Uncharacterized protein n=1 Tax=Tectimicrobiota bacterium TaxID=2528274 RepID=A0A932CMH2_UNCTE|nr:hypothetical protein [Candidatus Tectomicrobia bacterium]